MNQIPGQGQPGQGPAQPNTQPPGVAPGPQAPLMIRANQVQNIAFLTAEEKTSYQNGLTNLWKNFEESPEGSQEKLNARRGIEAFSKMLQDKLTQKRAEQARLLQMKQQQLRLQQQQQQNQQAQPLGQPQGQPQQTQQQPPPPPPQQQQQFSVGPPHHPGVPIGVPVAHHPHSHPQPSPIAPNFPTPNRHHQPPPMGTPIQQHAPAMPQQLAPGPSAGNTYNAPRAPETYTLAENIDSEIPEEVKKQFQTDDQGRVLFFTAPPLNRPSIRNGGVAEQYAGLGHSVHWESIKTLREERRRKRKERDEALQEEENKRKAAKIAEEKASGEGDEHKQALTLLEKGILQWCEQMQKGTKHLEELLGGREEWEEMMKQSKEENKDLTEAEIRKKNLRWWFEDQIKKGLVTEEERKQLEEAFLADEKGLTSLKATGVKA